MNILGNRRIKTYCQFALFGIGTVLALLIAGTVMMYNLAIAFPLWITIVMFAYGFGYYGAHVERIERKRKRDE